MDKILEKIEKFFSEQLEKFEKEPVKTSLKAMLVYWVVKKIYDELK